MELFWHSFIIVDNEQYEEEWLEEENIPTNEQGEVLQVWIYMWFSILYTDISAKEYKWNNFIIFHGSKQYNHK